ncbi:Crp/Fnr family transcriptional regulator [Occallatibacter savannae]|uniref:Crp/Fnr family transcriptional regulator n=1 Tax=Occallatibacter savannae TaxID=1002691 RepID=UPI0013A55956|nr:Crp/Fnr family transcriptional regulator [Occallatibacter savannae]
MDAKSHIFSQGTLPTHLHILCRGFVKLTVKRGSRHSAVVRVASPGAALGLFAALSDCEYELSAHTLTPVHLRSLSRDAFLSLMSKWPEIQRRALQSICQDYFFAHQQFCRAVLSANVDDRLNQLLVDMAGSLDSDSEEAGLRIPFLLTQSEIATMIGTTRESVSRSLRELRKRESREKTISGIVPMRESGTSEVMA